MKNLQILIARLHFQYKSKSLSNKDFRIRSRSAYSPLYLAHSTIRMEKAQ